MVYIKLRCIRREQFITEVKGIYAGLIMVELKLIEADNAVPSEDGGDDELNSEEWQTSITMHGYDKMFLHQHHGFFLASQHPSTSHALRSLLPRFAMPAPMWRHGIHSFLDLLRRHLPGSLGHITTFIHLAYSMIALLQETVPAFDDTWIECLGDLGRYRCV